ncbi:MAG: hypothetical protein P1U44_02930 [Vicingaceae bacterium]|nr:hypothetical protein [Flavobacteriales bacterium]MDF1674645.1 hypothetical protein [Vicingaceae bacterium]
MKIFTSISLKQILIACLFCAIIGNIQAQIMDSVINRVPHDTSKTSLNMDAVYNRPFLTTDKLPVALGGYLEANSFYSSEDGVSEGLSFQARRLTVFMSASISKRIKFLSEIEFEDGTKEIGIEFAAMDVTFHPAFNFRGGIIMNPIGAFNQNHDGPKWEFVERPDVAVNMLPATWSNAGFGLFGKTHKKNWVLGYEVYLTNGFDNSIIDNEDNKTFLPAAKENKERFEESNNGKALVTGKLAIKNRKIGEIGFSYMGGIYNKFEEDGLIIDEQRRLDVFAVDFNTTIKKTATYIVGEYVIATIDVPETYTQQFGNKQQGFFIDMVQTIFKRKILDWENASFNFAARLDYVDWNVGKFKENDANIGEDLFAISPAISFRPTSQTVFRVNYRYQWQRDILNNPPSLTAAWLFGFSTYF